MRDPYREPKCIGWKIKFKGLQHDQLVEEGAGAVHLSELSTPTTGLLFYPGFLFPPLWWIGSFLFGPKFDSQVASDQKWSSLRVQLARDQELSAKVWRDRCRFAALVSLVTYLPLIVLLAVFIPK